LVVFLSPSSSGEDHGFYSLLLQKFQKLPEFFQFDSDSSYHTHMYHGAVRALGGSEKGPALRLDL